MKRYKILEPVNYKIWHGRVDDEEDYDAFRWHQWVNIIDLEEMDEPLSGPLNICFVGFSCDQGVERNKGRIGASKGPNSIRKELSNLPCQFKPEVKLYDVGNVVVKNVTLEEGQEALAGIVERVLELNMFPIVLGGGHEIAFGHYMGLKRVLKKNLGIINFDAHLDLRPYDQMGSSGTMFRQIYDICQDNGDKYGYLCLGAQRRGNTVKLFNDARAMGVQYEFSKNIYNELPFKKIDDFMAEYEHIYVTICADVFSAAYAPGVSAPQTIGLEPEQVIRMLKYIMNSGKLISFDIAEVSPRFDHDRVTSNLAAVLIFAVVNTLCKLNNLEVNVY